MVKIEHGYPRDQFVDQCLVVLRMVGVARTEVKLGNADGGKEDVTPFYAVDLLLNLGETIREPVDDNSVSSK